MNAPSSNVADLRCAIENMDAFSYDGLSKIEAIANLALARLEMPEAYSKLGDIAVAFLLIKDLAFDVINNVNSEAESAGCAAVDAAQQRRTAARAEARKQDILRLSEAAAQGKGVAA